MTARGRGRRGVPPAMPMYLSTASRALLFRYGYWDARGMHRDHLEYEVRALRFVLGEVLDELARERGREYIEEVSHGVAAIQDEQVAERAQAGVPDGDEEAVAEVGDERAGGR